MKDFRENHLQKSLEYLKSGKIIIFPTDTQWAIACDAFNEEAIERLYFLKKRPKEKRLIWMASDFDIFAPFLEDEPSLKALALKHWPGPLTLLFKKKENNRETQAVRIPNNKTSLLILDLYKGILATSSANISGGVPNIELEDIIKVFGKETYIVPALFDEKMSGLASTIVGLNDQGSVVVHRQGGIQL